MKKRIKYIFTLFLLTLIFGKVEALSVSKNTLTIDEGNSDTVELYANVGDKNIKEISFSFVYDSYDAPANFIPVSGYNSTSVGTSHTIIFTEGKSGQILLGTIKVEVIKNPKIVSSEARAVNVVATTDEDEKINLKNAAVTININKVTPTVKEENTTTANVNTTTTTTTTTRATTRTTTTTVGTTTTVMRENKGLLKDIESKIVKIDLKDDIFEYTVSVREGIQELDLKVIPNDDKTKIDISSQKISELDNNKIFINLSNDTLEEKYVINVNVVSKSSIKDVEIDREKFVEKTGYRGKWLVAIVLLAITLVVSVLFVSNKKK